jgi:hypothetical protein
VGIELAPDPGGELARLAAFARHDPEIVRIFKNNLSFADRRRPEEIGILRGRR